MQIVYKIMINVQITETITRMTITYNYLNCSINIECK